MARRAEGPAAARVTGAVVRVEHAAATVERQGQILDVDVIDAVGKAAYELGRLDALPVQMARIERETELLATAQDVEDRLGAVEIEGNLPGMHLQGETNPGF